MKETKQTPTKVYDNTAHKLRILCEVFKKEATRISPGCETDITISNLPVHSVIADLLQKTDNPDKYVQELFPGYCNYESKHKDVKLESEYFYIT